jgi:SRSO17 transposase
VGWAPAWQRRCGETGFDISLRLQFDTEENRRRWVASDDHQRVWPQALELSRQAEWVGYEVIGRDGE